jgi:hypothetical protein
MADHKEMKKKNHFRHCLKCILWEVPAFSPYENVNVDEEQAAPPTMPAMKKSTTMTTQKK